MSPRGRPSRKQRAQAFAGAVSEVREFTVNSAGARLDKLIAERYPTYADADVTVRPVEAAVGAQRADALRMLLANGAAIDNRERRVLRCYEQRRRDSGVRELLGGESEALDCSGVRLPIDEGSR